MYKFVRIMNLTLGCEFTKLTKSRAHLSLSQVRFESGAPFIGMSLGNYGTVLGSLSQSNIATFQPFHRPSLFSFIFGIGQRANQNKESVGLVTTSARGWARRSNSLGKKRKRKSVKKKPLGAVYLHSCSFVLFFVLKESNHFRCNETCQFFLSFCVV